ILKTKNEVLPVEVVVPETLKRFMVHLVRMLRNHKDLEKKPSVRATIGLYERTKAHAALHGRKTAQLEDLEAIYLSVLAHRIRLAPSLRYSKEPNQIIAEQFKRLVERTDLSSKEEDVP
ncbi:MAG: hypothetical protein QW594_03585, partial [Candidatus Woesearchaeota archaeon]